MTKPGLKPIGDDADEALDEGWDEGESPDLKPSGPASLWQRTEPGPADASDPPTSVASEHEDPSEPAVSARGDGPEELAAQLADADNAPPSSEVSTRYQKGSLVEWLSLIEFVEGDALVTIESSDGRKGDLSCSGGQIIDARCGALSGEEAFFELVATDAGHVSLAFVKSQRAQVISTSTKDLLLKAAAQRAERRSSMLPPSPAMPGIQPATVSGIRDRAEEREEPPSQTAPEPAAPAEPAARGTSDGYLRTVIYLAVLTVVVAGAFVAVLTSYISHSPRSASESPSAAPANESRAPVSEEPPVMDLDVDPPGAEIWLDDELVGQGHVRRKLARDGREHEVRLVAPGYVAQSIFFRDGSLVRRVFLEKVVAERAATEATGGDHGAARAPERGPRPKHAITPAPAASPKPTDVMPPAESSSAKVPDAPLPVRPKTPSRSGPRVQIVD